MRAQSTQNLISPILFWKMSRACSWLIFEWRPSGTALAISRVNLDHVSEKKKSEVEKNYAAALFGHLFWVIESPYES